MKEWHLVRFVKLPRLGNPRKIVQHSGNGISSVLFSFRVRDRARATVMPTANEYRLQARQCQELANRANELYVRNALIELAREYDRAARQTERRERDLDTLAFPDLRAPSSA